MMNAAKDDKIISGVRITIVRATDLDHFPGWVEGVLTDAWGREWAFVEKVPVICLVDIDETTSFPQPGVIAGQILRRYRDADGRELVRIDTEKPRGVWSTTGQTQFDVLLEQLTQC